MSTVFLLVVAESDSTWEVVNEDFDHVPNSPVEYQSTYIRNAVPSQEHGTVTAINTLTHTETDATVVEIQDC